MISCILCSENHIEEFLTADGLDYFFCPRCGLVFKSPEHYIPAEEEHQRYRHHQNSPNDPGYRRFLGRLADPLSKRLNGFKTGLDFGCGPGPVLAEMLKEAGHSVDVYDPLFYPDDSVLRKTYDFISSTEVVEHMHFPGRDLNRLWDMLNPGGILALMTAFRPPQNEFATWYYKNDPTHVCFYSERSFRYLAESWGCRLDIPVKDLAFFHKADH